MNSKTVTLILSLSLSSAGLAGGAAPMPMSGTVTVNGAQVFYKTEGSGQPLLLIHGYPLSGELFKNNRSVLSKSFQVITIDLPGFGKSVAPDRNASIENYAKTVLGFMDAMKIKSATVGGMSMGGMTLLEMYKQAPERLKGLILIDTTADPAGVAEAASWRGNAQQAEQMGVASLAPGLLPRMLTGVSRERYPNQVAHLSSLIKQASLNGAIGGGNALAARPDANPTLPTIKVPTLIIVGVEDNVTPLELAVKMQAAIPGSQLVQVPGAGHAATFEKAAATNQAILNWASRYLK